MQLSTKFLPEIGRFEVGLLWRYENVTLLNSKAMAMSRMKCLERKLIRDPDFKINFNHILEDYMSKGYIRALTASEIQQQHDNVWYLPMFIVTNPKKPGRIRPVWDAAAKVNGVALNDVLLKGEDLNSSLVDVLMMFREGKVALNADIEQMFHRVTVRQEDQHAQRFLWRNCEKSREPTVYALTVLSFGSTSSPYQALYVMQENADKYHSEFPRAVNSIKQNHYMDDCLDSVPTTEEAISLARQVREIHAHGGLNIRNWRSNIVEVAHEMNGTSQSSSMVQMVSPDDDVPKALGMFWDTNSDSITYSLKYNKASKAVLQGLVRPSKREVLRTHMSIYDPLGLLEHYKIGLKIVQRESWQLNLGWDQQIPDELNEKWELWRKVLTQIESLKIPRCYLQLESTWRNCTVELHTFVDASEQLFAAASYLRVQGPNQVTVILVATKSRSAPLKHLSIPRLELQAAVLGTRLERTVTSALRIKIHRSTIWSDSTTVLHWLRSPRKLPTFISFRVGEILETTNVSSWRYVPTKMNIADDATKFKIPFTLSAEHQWFTGPTFLKQEEVEWPKSSMDEIDMDAVKTAMVHEAGFYTQLFEIERFSSWEKLLRAATRAIRFFNVMKSVKNKQCPPSGLLTSDEFAFTEREIYKQAQGESFHSIVQRLREKRPITKRMPFFKVSPFLDKFGVLRVKGRIDASPTASDDEKSPIILPRNHPLTKLIIDREHKRCLHQFSETVFSNLRQRFFIPSMRRAIKELKKSCYTCRIRDAKPLPPPMAPLPPCRLAEFSSPFAHTGVDFFGPITVSIQRRHAKRWGVIFTCLTVRAVHIELATSLSTDDFLLCMRNFTNRRGQPREWYSDQGTNFVGAERVLKEIVQQIDFNRVASQQTTSTVKWNFNPPGAPHMGGSWERLIRSIKSGLKAMIPPNCSPTPELLQSSLIEIEAVINSRPLFYVPLENCEQAALTPRDILIGSSGDVKALGDPAVDGRVTRSQWRTSQIIAQRFWHYWIKYYRPNLLLKPKWHETVTPLKEGDQVIVVDENDRSRQWQRGRIIKVHPAPDGQVRKVSVQTKNGLFERPAVKIAKLMLERSGTSSTRGDVEDTSTVFAI